MCWCLQYKNTNFTILKAWPVILLIVKHNRSVTLSISNYLFHFNRILVSENNIDVPKTFFSNINIILNFPLLFFLKNLLLISLLTLLTFFQLSRLQKLSLFPTIKGEGDKFFYTFSYRLKEQKERQLLLFEYFEEQ